MTYLKSLQIAKYQPQIPHATFCDQIIILESLHLRAVIRKPLCEAWFRCIESNIEVAKPIDLIILVAFQVIKVINDYYLVGR